MVTIHTTTFRSAYQGVDVRLSMFQTGANSFMVRCQPCGYPVISQYDTPCQSLAEAERLFNRKLSIGMGA